MVRVTAKDDERHRLLVRGAFQHLRSPADFARSGRLQHPAASKPDVFARLSSRGRTRGSRTRNRQASSMEAQTPSRRCRFTPSARPCRSLKTPSRRERRTDGHGDPHRRAGERGRAPGHRVPAGSPAGELPRPAQLRDRARRRDLRGRRRGHRAARRLPRRREGHARAHRCLRAQVVPGGAPALQLAAREAARAREGDQGRHHQQPARPPRPRGHLRRRRRRAHRARRDARRPGRARRAERHDAQEGGGVLPEQRRASPRASRRTSARTTTSS